MVMEISRSAISPTMIVLIVIVALLLFGPSKLPELGRSFGKTLREFKKGAQDIMNPEDDAQPTAPAPRKEIGPEAQTQTQQAQPAQPVQPVQPITVQSQAPSQSTDSKRLPD